MRTNCLPGLKRWVRFLFKLYAFPGFNRINAIKQHLCYHLNIPATTQFSPKFYCAAGNLNIGHNVSLSDTFVLDYGLVTIGNNVSFSYKNTIITSTHDVNDFDTVLIKPVIIGDNVWITTSVIILPGVKIGSNTIVGAGSVVSRDIPEGVFAAGNPCVAIKKIEFTMNAN